MPDAADIERMAREAGARDEREGQGGTYCELVLRSWFEPTRPDLHLNGLLRFAALVRAAARTEAMEECALIADDMDYSPDGVIAKHIRAAAQKDRP